jgi:hypothetical protein
MKVIDLVGLRQPQPATPTSPVPNEFVGSQPLSTPSSWAMRSGRGANGRFASSPALYQIVFVTVEYGIDSRSVLVGKDISVGGGLGCSDQCVAKRPAKG